MATDIILLMIAPHYVVEIAAISIHQQADLTCTIIYIWQRLISPYQVLCNRQTLPWLTIVQWPLKIWQLVKLAQSHYSGQALFRGIKLYGKCLHCGTYRVWQGNIIFFPICWWLGRWLCWEAIDYFAHFILSLCFHCLFCCVVLSLSAIQDVS